MTEWILLLALLIVSAAWGMTLFALYMQALRFHRLLEEAHRKVLARDLTDYMNAAQTEATLRTNHEADYEAIRKSPAFQRAVNQSLQEFEMRAGGTFPPSYPPGS